MQLTRFTDLGLRILMRLAVPAPDAPALTTRAVADQVAVNYHHATKVVARLQELGVVETRRGRHGGLSLTEQGRAASIGWLARQLEGHDEVIECGGENPCPLREACRLRSVLRTAQEAFFQVLDPYTVDDLTQAPTATVLLTLSARPPG
ncbi:MAG TPA: Rrf2 family transcriptional regulator [Nocardioides sp.]|uniref:RrF2 family transcriptional regulator n=1 Tax=Nocardioides sp. TaxID=35761 RepID=UPI002C388FCB|nr:Rrf2 family transcriptional regulator [Nocardioides sp.]HTW16496.1 Rrf2 family transcriptional regulator [Nocardioides sp.]